MTKLLESIKTLLRNILLFCEHGSGLKLRKYQECVAKSIADSVTNKQGLTFVVIFPRQSGKNELQAQIECYLLSLLSILDAEIVKVSPTWKPQSLNAMRRLERVLRRNLVTTQLDWDKEQGYIYRVGTARIYFLSGSPTANIVGATASTLLECDEAQDVTKEKWDKEVNPMAASTNATRVFWGTAWTSQTLLAREKRAALKAQEQDGVQRVFEIDADLVREEVPAYGDFVDGEITKLGRNHPFVRTQYFSEEIDAQGGMFAPERLALMKGDHLAQLSPTPGSTYAFLLDVAGENTLSITEGTLSKFIQSAAMDLSRASGRAKRSRNAPGEIVGSDRDSTALTIVEIDLSTLSDELIQAPRYLVVQRRLWKGESQPSLYAQIKALAEVWNPLRLVIDATGIGAGLASFLAKALPGQVLPFVFTARSKSDLGWKFLSVIETGRFKDYKQRDELQQLFFNQLEHVEMEILLGPGKMLRWSVPDGARDLETGDPIHDDLVISAALCALLDEQTWGSAESAIIRPYDPLLEMEF